MTAAGEAGGAGTVLGIETATPHGSVALAGGGRLLGELHFFNPRTHSERILPAVENLLGTLGLKPRDLAAVAVSIGPGSFTGLRIGVAAAKGLAFSLGLPLYGIPTLEALAANAAPRTGVVCALIDARRGEVFTARYRFRDGRLTERSGARIVPPEAALGNLPKGSIVVGEPPPGLRTRFVPGGRGGPFLAPPHLSFPRAAVSALRGEELLRDGNASAPETVLPRYIRPSDAEANRAGKD